MLQLFFELPPSLHSLRAVVLLRRCVVNHPRAAPAERVWAGALMLLLPPPLQRNSNLLSVLIDPFSDLRVLVDRKSRCEQDRKGDDETYRMSAYARYDSARQQYLERQPWWGKRI